MKGVSEIIAIILILMIVIALAALAYTWFSGVFASITGSANTAITNNQNQMNTQFRIESVKSNGVSGANGYVTVSIRNLGTTSINGSTASTGFYVDGNLIGAAPNPFLPAGPAGQPISCNGCSGNPGINTMILSSGVATYNMTYTTLNCPSCPGTCISAIKITNGPAVDSRSILC